VFAREFNSKVNREILKGPFYVIGRKGKFTITRSYRAILY
jgi:hypothetical protein